MQKQFLVHKRIMFFSLGLLAVFVLSGCQRDSIFRNNSSDIKVSNKVQGGQVAVLDSDIIVTSPLSDEELTSPITVTGRTKTSGLVTMKLIDANNNVITTIDKQNDIVVEGWGLFESVINFENPATPTGWLEVRFSADPSSSKMDLIKLPIRFKNYQIPTVSVFFSNSIKDPELLNCSVVYPVVRPIESISQAVISSLNYLIAGPTAEEIEQGFSTSIPSGEVKVQNIKSENGIVTVDFNKALDEGVAGSCRVGAIRAQIEETIKQFQGVEEVVITIDGQADTVLQP